MTALLPDSDLRRRPPVNKIGDDAKVFQMTPTADRRKIPEMMEVWDPDGVPHEHTLSNARDLLNHGTLIDGVYRRWTSYDPSKTPKTPTTEVGQGSEDTTTPAHVTAATSRLETLRSEAIALGIVVDKRWGLQRLTDEIEAKK